MNLVSRDWKYSFDQQVDNSNDVEIKMLLTQNLDLQGATKASALCTHWCVIQIEAIHQYPA